MFTDTKNEAHSVPVVVSPDFAVEGAMSPLKWVKTSFSKNSDMRVDSLN
jgi:hypothetical protein